MSATDAALQGRMAAEAQMVDECEIRRPATLGPMDPVTGVRPEIPGDPVYDGACKVQTYEPFESTPQSGQHYFTVQRYSVHIPAGTPGVQVNDEVTLVSSLLEITAETGRKFRIAGLLHKTYATAQRLLVDEITA